MATRLESVLRDLDAAETPEMREEIIKFVFTEGCVVGAVIARQYGRAPLEVIQTREDASFAYWASEEEGVDRPPASG